MADPNLWELINSKNLHSAAILFKLAFKLAKDVRPIGLC